jgi:hypothetical protein
MKNYPSLQAMLFIFLSILNLLYIIYFRPFSDRATNFNEIFNEGCILMTSYTLFIFTDYVNSFQVK